MNLTRLLVLTLLLPVLIGLPDNCEAQSELLITGGHVFDTEQETFRSNQGIVINGDRFESVNGTDGPGSARHVQLGDDDYILPGLFDLHAHYNVRLIARRREEFHVMPVVYLANGVTATFSAGEYDPEGMQELKERINSGEQIGPKLLTSGPYFGRVRRGWRNITHDQIAADVGYWAKRGVAGFKAKAIGPDHLETLIREAHLHGLTVTGHLDSGFRGSVNPRDAIRLGIDRIEHFLGGDAMPGDRSAYSSLASITPETPGFNEIVDLYIQTGTRFDCTITAYGYFGERGEEFDYWIDEREFFTPYIRERISNQRREVMNQFEDIYQAKLKTVGEFHRRGGTLTLGTDHFSSGDYLPGFGAHRELDALVRGGISEAAAIRIATLNGAEAMGLEENHGSITQGKVADLFIVRGNPLDNIRNTRNVKFVVRAGVMHDAEALLDSVRGQLGPQNDEEAAEW